MCCCLLFHAGRLCSGESTQGRKVHSCRHYPILKGETSGQRERGRGRDDWCHRLYEWDYGVTKLWNVVEGFVISTHKTGFVCAARAVSCKERSHDPLLAITCNCNLYHCPRGTPLLFLQTIHRATPEKKLFPPPLLSRHGTPSFVVM